MADGQDTTCRMTNSTGEARWRYRDDHRARDAYRVRASFGGDALNLGGHGAMGKVPLPPLTYRHT
jgi:hypothetical protein